MLNKAYNFKLKLALVMQDDNFNSCVDYSVKKNDRYFCSVNVASFLKAYWMMHFTMINKFETLMVSVNQTFTGTMIA